MQRDGPPSDTGDGDGRDHAESSACGRPAERQVDLEMDLTDES
jgi:hypothetical protein